MMQRVVASCALLACLGSATQASLGAAGQAREQALSKSWSQVLDTQPAAAGKAYQSPIKRVVSLLEKMRAELVHEADNEAEMYDKMVCWCETNEKEKKKAIADAEVTDKELTAEIGARAAKFGEDETEIARLKEQIAADGASLKQATSIREADAAKFYESNKDLVQSITNVKNAINVLGKHNAPKTMFVQLDAGLASSIRAVMKDLAFKQQMLRADQSEHPKKSSGASFLSTSTDSSLVDFMQGDDSGAMPLEFAQKVLARAATTGSAFLQAGTAPSGGSYAPQSNQIFGILTTMKDGFEANLGTEGKEEEKAAADFEAMSKAKAAQIAVGKEKLDALE